MMIIRRKILLFSEKLLNIAARRGASEGLRYRLSALGGASRAWGCQRASCWKEQLPDAASSVYFRILSCICNNMKMGVICTAAS